MVWPESDLAMSQPGLGASDFAACGSDAHEKAHRQRDSAYVLVGARTAGCVVGVAALIGEGALVPPHARLPVAPWHPRDKRHFRALGEVTSPFKPLIECACEEPTVEPSSAEGCDSDRNQCTAQANVRILRPMSDEVKELVQAHRNLQALLAAIDRATEVLDISSAIPENASIAAERISALLDVPQEQSEFILEMPLRTFTKHSRAKLLADIAEMERQLTD
jgi:hypothetical protein